MDQGLAIVLAAVISSVVIAIEHTLTRRSVRVVDGKVDTLNESTLGQLAAERETRRVEDIPHDDRTAQEQRHVDTAPEKEPPQGPGR